MIRILKKSIGKKSHVGTKTSESNTLSEEFCPTFCTIYFILIMLSSWLFIAESKISFAHTVGDEPVIWEDWTVAENPDGIIEGTPVHQYIAWEAGKALQEIQEELKDHLLLDEARDTVIYQRLSPACNVPSGLILYNIISGSGDEDNQINPLYCDLLDRNEFCDGERLNGWYEHFWDPDRPSYEGFNCNQEDLAGGYNRGLRNILPGEPVEKTKGEKYWDSNYRLAQYYWDQKVIGPYRSGKKEGNEEKVTEAYYWLGHVVHLLTDITVPAHVHDDVHVKNTPYGEDSFEEYMKNLEHLNIFQGAAYAFDIYKYEDLEEKISAIKPGFSWSDVHDQKDPPNLFKLFWYTAQKTQYFASNNSNGDLGKFVKWDGAEDKFDSIGRGLWTEISPDDIIDDKNDVEAYVSKIAVALVPHAIKAVAGLYRLFCFETHEAVDILSPTESAPASVGSVSDPRKLNIEVTITFGTPLTKEDFAVYVGSSVADVRAVAMVGDRYVLNIQPPNQSTEGSYDLRVTARGLSDKETAAILYASNTQSNADVVLTLDRSGSMYGEYLASAKDAAGLFVDLMQDGDMVGIVSFSDAFTLDYGLATITSTKQIIFSDDMESGTGNWIWNPPWAQIKSDYHSPTTCWTDSPDGNYSDNANVSLGSPPIDLSSLTNPVLKFWTRYSLEEAWWFYGDYARVWATIDNGSTYDLLAEYTGDQSTWTQKLVNLSSYSGLPSVRVVFQLSSDGSFTYDGWYVDDVEISAADARAGAKEAIGSISAEGSTSIGAGLQLAQSELNNKGASGHPWAIILLSDGFENTPPYVSEVLPSILSTKTKIYTIALGPNSDEALLQDIARQTSGQYYLAPSATDLAGIYSSLSSQVMGNETLFSETGRALQGVTDQKIVRIDPSVSQAIFSISWSGSGSNLDLTLTDPNGKNIAPSTSDPKIKFISSSNSESYRVTNPALGNWIMKVYGGTVLSMSSIVPSPILRDKENWIDVGYGDTAPDIEELTLSAAEQTGLQYNANVAADTNLTITTRLEQGSYEQSDPILITAIVTDTQPIVGANVIAEVTSPSSSADSITLYDDGIHGDGKVNDGVYANAFNNTGSIGTYSFLVRAAGTSNTGFKFQRVGYTSTYVNVADGPNISVSPFSCDFGNIILGKTSVPHEFIISNTGVAGLLIDQPISLIGANGETFTLIPGGANPCPSLQPYLAEGSSCTIIATFSPETLGRKVATISISSNDADTPMLSVPLYGAGTPEKVTLFTPNGGEIIPSGSDYAIRWAAPSNAVKFRLSYSLDKGATWMRIHTEAFVTGVVYDWQVSKPGNNKKNCLLRVVGYDALGKKIGAYKSDGSFTIEVVKLISPNGGEIFKPGDTCKIEWANNETKNPVAKANLSYTVNGGKNWNQICDPPAGKCYFPGDSRSFDWQVPTVKKEKTKCKIKVVLQDADGNGVGSDVSDGCFSIEP